MVIVKPITHAEQSATSIDLFVGLLPVYIKGTFVALPILRHTRRHDQTFSREVNRAVQRAAFASVPIETSMRFVDTDALSVDQPIPTLGSPGDVLNE